MKTKHLPALVIMLLSIFSFGQKKADYFQKILDTTSNAELKLASIDSLIFFYEDHNKELSADYTDQYIDLAISLEKYDDAIEMGIRFFHMINIQMGKRDRALRMIEKLEFHIDKINDSYLKGGIYLKKGGGYVNGKDFQQAVKYFSKAINLYSDKDSIYKADAIFFRGQAHFGMSEFSRAINDYRLASQYYENLGDNDYTFYTLGNAIGIYSAMGFIEKAIEEREKFIQKKLDMKYTNSLTSNYYNQSISYKKLGNKEKQLEYLKKSLETSKNDKDGYVIPTVYSSLSKYYADTDLKKSKEFLDLAKNNLTKRNTTFHNQQYIMAEAYYISESGNRKKAIDIYKNLLNESLAINNSSLILEINRELYKNYEANRDVKKALKYYKNYTRIKDSLFNRTKTNALAYYQTLYETEKKESEILKQKSSLETLEAENTSKNRLIIFGGIGLLFIFLLILLYRNREYLRKKNKLQKQFAQNLLVSQDLERKRISKDLHDSLGQSLLLVKNKMSNENSEAKGLLNNAIDEMRNVSRSLYPFQLKEVGITSAINNLIDELDKNYPETYIFGDIDDIDGVLSIEQELNLFRVIQECFSNVIKHAKAKSAKIHLEKKEQEIVIILQDNGIGFDFSKKFQNLKSLGLKTIKERVRFLNGILRVDSNERNGSKFKIVIQTL